MSKKEQIDKLARKYFWEQKKKEIVKIILVIIIIPLVVIVIPFLIGMGVRNLGGGENEGLIPDWFLGLGIIFILIIIISFIYLITTSIKEWIESNKRKARQRAREEVYGSEK